MTTTQNTISADPARAMQDMMDSIDALRAVYAKETAALRAADTPAFFALQDEKIAAAQTYHDRASAFIMRRDELKAANPNLKNLLRAKQEDFTRTAIENQDALERMRRTMERMGQRLIRAAREMAAQDSVSYGAGGNLNRQRNAPVTTGISESA